MIDRDDTNTSTHYIQELIIHRLSHKKDSAFTIQRRYPQFLTPNYPFYIPPEAPETLLLILLS